MPFILTSKRSIVFFLAAWCAAGCGSGLRVTVSDRRAPLPGDEGTLDEDPLDDETSKDPLQGEPRVPDDSTRPPDKNSKPHKPIENDDTENPDPGSALIDGEMEADIVFYQTRSVISLRLSDAITESGETFSLFVGGEDDAPIFTDLAVSETSVEGFLFDGAVRKTLQLYPRNPHLNLPYGSLRLYLVDSHGITYSSPTLTLRDYEIFGLQPTASASGLHDANAGWISHRNSGATAADGAQMTTGIRQLLNR